MIQCGSELAGYEVAVGEFVEEDGIIAVIETDKVRGPLTIQASKQANSSTVHSPFYACQVAFDARSPVAGTVTAHLASEGDTVPVGAPLATVAPGEGASASAGATAGAGAGATVGQTEQQSTPQPPQPAETAPEAPASEVSSRAARQCVRVSPGHAHPWVCCLLFVCLSLQGRAKYVPLIKFRHGKRDAIDSALAKEQATSAAASTAAPAPGGSGTSTTSVR